MPYCLYLRKSRADLEAEARGEGESLARHEQALLACAKQQKLTITAIYKEIVSGETIAARPVMQQLLTEIEQGAWDGVLVMEVERLARGDTIDQGVVSQAFQLSGTKIITPIKTYDPTNEFDEEYFEFGLFMSRREYKTINRRMQRGRIASINEGKWVGNKTPQGYTRVKLPDQKGWTLVPDVNRAYIVQQIFDWFTAPYPNHIGISLIVRRLNEMGILSATGKDWTNPAVRDILSNPVYAGWIRWGERAAVKSVENGTVKRSRPRANPEDIHLTKGLHEPLITQDTFDAAQKLLKSNPSVPGAFAKGIKNPLSGLVVCKNCGRHMVRRPYQNGYSDTLICPYTSCTTVSSHLDVVEDAVLDFLRKWASGLYAEGELFPQSEQSIETLEKTKCAVEKDLLKIHQQELKAYDLLEQEVYSTEIFLQRTAALSERKSQLQEQLNSLEMELQQLEKQRSYHENFVPRVKNVLSLYPNAVTAKEKNDLLKIVVARIEYKKTKRIRENGGDMVIEVFPKFES